MTDNCEMCRGAGAIPVFERDQDGNFMEHRCPQCDGSGEATGKWQEWFSDRCPLSPKKPVFVKYRNGEIDSGLAINFNWHHEGVGRTYPYDIVAYKVGRHAQTQEVTGNSRGPAQAEQQEAQGAQAGDAPKIPPMGKLDIPARGVTLNECHCCGWLGGENEVPGEEDQCYCPNCRSDNIDDDVNLPRLFDLVRYLARAALATQPAAGEPAATVLSSRAGNDTSTIDKALPDGTKLFLAPPAAAHGDEAVLWDGEGIPPVGTLCEVLWNEARMEYLKTVVFGVNEHGQPIHRFEEGPKKYEYQADVLVTCTGTKVFRPIDAAMRAQGDGNGSHD